MRAFWNNGLGYDRYGVIYGLKEKYGKLMKDPSLSDAEHSKYSILRGGTKLILNSVSGAADAGFETAVRMNNRIISMRIIGQLFTWRIAQAQTLAGARVTSTNTDGLYSALDENISNSVLEKESSTIGVDIEPERMYLITKDSNNRVECAVKDDGSLKITAAGGGSVGCRKGPNLTKSLDHPAIIDWAMAEYLTETAKGNRAAINQPFNDALGKEIIERGLQGGCIPNSRISDKAMILVMAQMITASSPSSHAWIFSYDNGKTVLQRFNRVFFMDSTYEGKTVLLGKAVAAIYHAEVKKGGLLIPKVMVNFLAENGSAFCRGSIEMYV